ncbi:triose-phosphate isomerase [Halopseudomonas phragmitis]|uniref:Triosephosphate isomerase n=2 Tax=Pseudomonadaceae TaxID=135621 RepID=A0A1V0B1H1_9GAMM|nr:MULTISPECIES: triose-phosphate isomerase [Pseudomonadaceae]AQZ93624.1 triose-phosphate isomerase [Halopseudomonas phragmitis]PAU86249.1 triose-phosphate isomerase [Pseudomonas sp. WN033]RHW20282.1 triose-phosphate isomerase [Pseudomonas jilinensis]
MRRPLVAGNWKMHGTRQSVDALLVALSQQDWPEQVELMIAPPALYIERCREALAAGPIRIGGQSCAHQAEPGALTGEISPAQLRDAGCEYVLVGHSERRTLFGESDEVVKRKFAAALACGLRPVLCVGETQAERDAGETADVIGRQLQVVLDAFGVGGLAQGVLAYEPVWAIGTGLTASPEQAQDVHAMIRARLALLDDEQARMVQIVYGGSVKADNAEALFAMPDIDGGLIGGASLNAEEFGAIARAAGRV